MPILFPMNITDLLQWAYYSHVVDAGEGEMQNRSVLYLFSVDVYQTSQTRDVT